MLSKLGEQTIGKYRILGEIGRGGMAVVYQGYDADLRRPVAIKVLPEALAADEQFVQRFKHEAIMAARLHHPNIVTIHDVGQQGSLHYIVMQYLTGATLDRVLSENGPLPLQAAASVIEQVASALDHAHQNGIYHRDVKPSNIMISPDGRVTLMDFGLVRAGETGNITRIGTVVGTPEYMSPEQAQGLPIDQRTDVYSLGVVLYKLLSGRSPYARSTPYATLLAHINEPLPLEGPLAKLPREVKRVLQKALAKSPQDRYTTAGAFAADLLKAAAAQPGHPVILAPTKPASGQETQLIPPDSPSPQPPAGRGTPVPAGGAARTPTSEAGKRAPQAASRPAAFRWWFVIVPVLVLALGGLVLWAAVLRPRASVPAASDVSAAVVSPVSATATPRPEPTLASVAAQPSATLAIIIARETVVATQIVVVTATPPPNTETPVPQPTATQAPSVIPTNTPSPPPTATKPAATNTPRPTQPPALAAPELLLPADNAGIASGETTFSWQWSGAALDANHAFEVRVWKEGQADHYGAAAPVRGTSTVFDATKSPAVLQGGSGSYFWTVAVVQLEPYQRIGPEAPPRVLQISASGDGAPPGGCPPGGCG